MGIDKLAGLKQVIMTLLDPALSPAKAGWGKKEWIAWRKLVSNFRHIGLELEYKNGMDYTGDYYCITDANRVTKLLHTRASRFEGGESECVQLFPLSSPSDFTSSVRRFNSTCAKGKINTLGSVHLNILRNWNHSSFGRVTEWRYYTDFERVRFGTSQYRSENKRFSGYILESDLIAQMILFLGAYSLCETREEYNQLLKLVKDSYPSSVAKWARIDLNKVLTAPYM